MVVGLLWKLLPYASGLQQQQQKKNYQIFPSNGVYSVFVGFVTQLCSPSNVSVCVEHGHTLCALIHKIHSEDTQQTMYLMITSPELLLTDELSSVDKPSSVVLQGRAKGHSSAGTWHKWVLNRISTTAVQQLQYHAHAKRKGWCKSEGKINTQSTIPTSFSH